MKTPLFALFCIASAALSQPVTDPFGGKNDEFSTSPTSVDGLWIREQADARGIKHIMNGRFNLTYLNPKTRMINHHMIGVFMEEKGKLKERARYVTPGWQEFSNRTRLSKFETDGPNVFTQAGVDRKDEVWIRMGPIPPAIVTQNIPNFSGEKSPIDGAWMFESPQGWRSLKIFDCGWFSVTHYDGRTKQVTRHMIGVYSLNGSTLTEKAIYTTENWKELMDRPFTLSTTIVPGESFTQTAGDGYSESYRWVSTDESNTAAK